MIEPMLAFLLLLPDFKTQTSFGFLIENYRGRFICCCCCKSQNELIWPKRMFLTMLLPESIIVQEYRDLAIMRVT